MAVFRFSLQKLLSLKEQYEKSFQNELGLAMKAIQAEKDKLAVIDAGISRFTEDYRRACSGNINPGKIKEIRNYLEVLYSAREKQESIVKRKQENVDKIREKLVEVMKERKVLENLKEKEFAKYREEEGKSEQKLTDELVSYKESIRKDSS